MSRPLRPQLLCLVIACTLAGCRLGVPLHVWQPPALESTVGKQVVVSTVAGPEKLAGQVREKLLATVPRDVGRQTNLVDYRTLQDRSEIQLVSSTDDEPNDLVLASVARREGAEFLLRGEVIESRHAMSERTEHDSLTVSWRLTSLEDVSSGGGIPITVDTQQAIDRYPDLALSGSRDEVLTTAAVRESYRLFTPSIRREQVEIENAYLLPGSRDVRRGNVAALNGKWDEAEAIWSEVVKHHPTQVPAIHNLALAAAAAQDFSKAKQLARRAIRLHPSSLHQETLAWIETRQREYHKAFGLPDPPEGWFVTSDPTVEISPR